MRPMKKTQDWGVWYVDWVTNGRGVIQLNIHWFDLYVMPSFSVHAFMSYLVFILRFTKMLWHWMSYRAENLNIPSLLGYLGSIFRIFRNFSYFGFWKKKLSKSDFLAFVHNLKA